MKPRIITALTSLALSALLLAACTSPGGTGDGGVTAQTDAAGETAAPVIVTDESGNAVTQEDGSEVTLPAATVDTIDDDPAGSTVPGETGKSDAETGSDTAGQVTTDIGGVTVPPQPAETTGVGGSFDPADSGVPSLSELADANTIRVLVMHGAFTVDTSLYTDGEKYENSVMQFGPGDDAYEFRGENAYIVDNMMITTRAGQTQYILNCSADGSVAISFEEYDRFVPGLNEVFEVVTAGSGDFSLRGTQTVASVSDYSTRDYAALLQEGDTLVTDYVFSGDDYHMISSSVSRIRGGVSTVIYSETIKYTTESIQNDYFDDYMALAKTMVTLHWENGYSVAYAIPLGVPLTYSCVDGYELYTDAGGTTVASSAIDTIGGKLDLYCLAK